MRTSTFKRALNTIKVRYIGVFAFLLMTTCLVLFMNCSLNEVPFNSEDLGSSIVETPPYDYTENPFSRQFPDPDDPETKKNIVTGGSSGGSEAEGEFNISDWEKTSEITEIDINIENGQICISHTKSGQWVPTQNVESPSVEDPVEGNAWVIVPLDGKGYAAPYDWLGANGPCHMLDVETLENLYQQLPQRTNMPELSRWKPVPGDKIGFMVSGLAKDGLENVKERSNMLIVTLPDAEGKIPLEVEEPCSEDIENSFCSENCNVPNRITVIEGIADRNPNPLIWIHQLYVKRKSDGPGSIEAIDERWEFMDRVAQGLHLTDDRFGYTCVNKDCNDTSTHQIAYKCEESSETNENIATVSFLTEDGKVQWQPDASQDVTVEDDNEEDQIGIVLSNTDGEGAEDDTEEEERSTHGWLYPREGANHYQDCVLNPSTASCQQYAEIEQAINNICASGGSSGSGSSFNPDSFSWDNVHFPNGGVIFTHDITNWSETSSVTSVLLSSNGICIDHTKVNVWKETFRPGFAHKDWTVQGSPWLFAPYNGTVYAKPYEHLRVGQKCKLGHNKNTLKGVIISLVAHFKSIHLQGQAQRNAIAPFKDWYPRPGDILGFLASTSNLAEATQEERSDIVWVRIPNYCQVNSGGEIVGRTSSLDDDDDNDNNNGLLDTHCTQEQLDSGYGTHPESGKCLPKCITFMQSNAKGVEIAEGNACDDDINYYTLPIKNTFEDKCCRRYSKSSCPPGYRKSNGNCYPTCERAAELAGHTNQAGDNRAGNYVLHEKQTLANDAHCRELDEYGPNGYGDWEDFGFYDPYTFTTLRNSNDTIYEIVIDPDDDYLCCIRSTPNSAKAPSYGTDGWTQEERNRFPATSTR